MLDEFAGRFGVAQPRCPQQLVAVEPAQLFSRRMVRQGELGTLGELVELATAKSLVRNEHERASEPTQLDVPAVCRECVLTGELEVRVEEGSRHRGPVVGEPHDRIVQLGAERASLEDHRGIVDRTFACRDAASDAPGHGHRGLRLP